MEREMSEKPKFTPGPLAVTATGAVRQFRIFSDTRKVRAEVEWDDAYVEFAGYFGSYGPHMFSAAPDLVELASEYEAWEADVILNADWTHDTPHLTQSQWDEFLRIQGKRNAALAKARGHV